MGTFSHINDAVENAFRKKFPEFELQVIDLKELIKGLGFWDKLFLFLKSITTTKGFSWKYIRSSFITNNHFWSLSNDLIRKSIGNKNFIFIFQMQSNYDGNVSKCPHYIYSDHTHLVNLTYPGFDKETLNSHEWIASETKLYQQASGIFTMSNHVKNSLFNQYHIPLDKIKCVYAGSNISYSDISYPLDRYAQKNILFVGVNWERKGGPELFEAFKLVYEKHLDANLHIVGCNPEIQHPNVKIWGKLPLDEVKKHYQSASVFCMPSRREPFGIVYLEAMAYKLPIIALKIGALPDFVEDAKNGFLLNYKDIHGLASKIIFLLDNPEISLEMGEYAYQKMEKQYQWEISLASIREFIENQGVIEKEN